MKTDDRNELQKLTDKLMRNTQDIEVLNERSIVYCRIGEWDKALKDIEKILEIDPKHEEAKLFLQRIKYQMELEAKMASGIPIDFAEAIKKGALRIPAAAILSRIGPAVIDYGNGNVVLQVPESKDI